MDWLAVVCYFALIAVMLAGFAVNVMGLPGLWAMLAGLAGYALATGWGVYVGWPGVLTVLVMVVAAEVLETVFGGAAARKAGGSTRAGFGALLGGLLGAIFLTIPLPVVGTMIGACVGAFTGALVAEFTVKGDPFHSARVGYAAAVGRLLGILTKLVIGIIVLFTAAVLALPVHAHRPPPATSPATTAPAATR